VIPDWPIVLSSVAVVLFAVIVFYAMTSSPYGDWVREFYAKRDKLQTLFGEDKTEKKSK